MTNEQARYVRELVCVGCTDTAVGKLYNRKYPDNTEPVGWLIVEAGLRLNESPPVWRYIAKVALIEDELSKSPKPLRYPDDFCPCGNQFCPGCEASAKP